MTKHKTPQVLREERLRQGLSLREVAGAAGISQQHLLRLERQQKSMTAVNAVRIGDFLGVPRRRVKELWLGDYAADAQRWWREATRAAK